MQDLIDPLDLLIRVPVVLFALTVHEFSHAYVAYRMGDPTAYRLGRCTLNPVKHLDPLGTICLMFGPIGWAKPVPVNPINFDDPRKGNLYTTFAGPLSNLIQAVIFAVLLRGLVHHAESALPMLSESAIDAAYAMLMTGLWINVGLAVFNLLPFYPLDGYHVSMELLPIEGQRRQAELANAGPFIIIGIVMLGRMSNVDILGKLMDPPFDFLLKYIAGIS